MATALLIVSFLVLVTSFVASFSKPTETLFMVGCTAIVLFGLALQTMWPVFFAGGQPLPNLLQRVLTGSFFSASAALWARLFIRQWKMRRQTR